MPNVHHTVDQQEVVTTVFLLTEEGVNHRTGGPVASSIAISSVNGGAWSPNHG